MIQPTTNSIDYTIRLDKANAHIFDVSINIPAHQQQALTLTLPAWLPGSYMIRDFAKNIITFKANDANQQAVAFHKVDKQTWQVETLGKAICVTYQVYAFDLSVRTAYLDNQRGFFNPSSTCLGITELKQLPCSLNIHKPEHFANWKVATGLPRDEHTNRYEFGRYLATDYQHLIDCPFELGNFAVFEFTVADVPHFMVFSGKHFADQARLIKDVQALCQHHIDLFGEAPFAEYWFITNLMAEGFGGLEHKNSTVLVASRFDLPNPNKPNDTSDRYKTFLSLCSHEYFHAWNVCRIKPAEFVPYDLSKEVHTTQLWAFEGITSYYDDFSLYRTGIVSLEDYLSLLSKTMTRVYRGQGELKQTVSESSFDAWTKFYQQGSDAVNNIVSYYTKGSLIALWLDLTIRLKSNGEYSLDNLMRIIWQQHGKTLIGTTENNYIDIANQLCGEDISAKMKALLHTANRVELSDLLTRVGIEFTNVPYQKVNSIEVANKEPESTYLGAFYKSVPGGLQVTVIEEGSPAELAGLSVNDVIIALDKMKMTEKSLAQLLAHLPIGHQLSCHYFRDDALCTTNIQLCPAPALAVKLTVNNENLNSRWLT